MACKQATPINNMVNVCFQLNHETLPPYVHQHDNSHQSQITQEDTGEHPMSQMTQSDDECLEFDETLWFVVYIVTHQL